MKGLKKIALVSAIAAISAGAQAELRALDDTSMGNLTGQAGISIDLTANVTIGEVAYKDEGFIAMRGIAVGGKNVENAGVAGATQTSLDNLTITIDVAGANDTQALTDKYGIVGEINEVLLKEADADQIVRGALGLPAGAVLTRAQLVGGLASLGKQTKSDELKYAAETTAVTELTGGDGIQDGDLVIHLSGTDSVISQMVDLDGDGTPETPDVTIEGVDFGFNMKEMSLEKSTYNAGDRKSGSANTVLVANLQLDGVIGPVDIIIDESNSTLGVNAYFKIDGGSLDVPFMGVSIGKFTMDDSRSMGDDVTTRTQGGFAHAAAVVSTTKADGSASKGLFVDVKDFSADMSMETISIGGNSIGDLYITDMTVTATMDVYGH